MVKAAIHGPKPVGSGPSGSVLVLETDQDQQNLEIKDRIKKLQSLGPDRTRTKKNFRTWDQTRTEKCFKA